MADTVGAMPPPPGFVPDYDNPKDALNTVMIATQALCILFVTVFVFLRIYVKLSILRSFGREDYTCVISWALCIMYCVIGILMTQNGAGYNQYEITVQTLTSFLKFGYAATIVYMPMAFVVKLALLFIITRVFSPYKKTIYFVYVFTALLLGYYVAGLVVKARPCMPVSAYWTGDQSKCLDQRAILICDSVASVISDLIILFLPLPLAWSLQMDIKKKLRVMGILAAGGLATAFSIYRLIMIVETGNSPNQTMVFTRVVLSGNAEIGIGLICACLPTLNALIDRSRRYHSSKNRMTNSRDHELSNVNGAGGGRMNHSKNDDTEAESDKDYLISSAQVNPGFETSVHRVSTPRDRGQANSFGNKGIVKTIQVSHAYEESK